jgi:hypothetical protein
MVNYRARVSIPLPAAIIEGGRRQRDTGQLGGHGPDLIQNEVHSTFQLGLGHAPVRREAHATWARVDDDAFRVELRLDCFRLVALEGDDPAAA